ncbi:MAG: 1-acyl-sn-glycerol-3-phosphate acyltransferase [Ignavibacteria bacterium]|nr:1-acyl-sn-glycerol-3-phosphate acyltransferase [Ignavibacteria bacterium]
MSYLKVFLIAISGLIIAAITIVSYPFDYRGKITYVLTRAFSKITLAVAGVKLTVEGKENIKKGESYIFVTNHQSMFDIPILMQAAPSNIRFIYKKSLTQIPIFGWAMYLSGYIPIDRSDARAAMKTLKDAAKRLVHGISLVIFPEGTRSEDGRLGEFKRGTFILAEGSDAKIIVGTIINSYKILSKGKLHINGGNVKVVFSKPLEYKKDKGFLHEIKNIVQSNLPNN